MLFRSLSLIIGGTQMAMTITVSVFMAGLALGSWFAGRHLHRSRRLLFLYGMLELGIALCALVFLALMKVYPDIYRILAGFAPDSTLYLTGVRIIFSAAAMIIPSSLMGATLPVLTEYVSGGGKSVSGTISILYGANTLGAVFGAAVTGFYFLKALPVSAVILLAALTNAAIGLVFIMPRDGAGFPQADHDAKHAGTPSLSMRGSSRQCPDWSSGASASADSAPWDTRCFGRVCWSFFWGDGL